MGSALDAFVYGDVSWSPRCLVAGLLANLIILSRSYQTTQGTDFYFFLLPSNIFAIEVTATAPVSELFPESLFISHL